jgi:hypothetical protein
MTAGALAVLSVESRQHMAEAKHVPRERRDQSTLAQPEQQTTLAVGCYSGGTNHFQKRMRDRIGAAETHYHVKRKI